MKRVVVVGIPLNVISTYALLETGWKTVLGNAEEGGLFLKKLKLPLKISERAWWLKVSLLSKHKSGVKGSGPAPTDLSTMNTGNPVNTDSTETKQTKRNTCCGCSSVAAVVPEDVVAKDLVTKGTKDSLTKDPVNHVATQEVAQVTKGRSGGSAKVKAKRRELQMKSADMLQSFSYVCRMFHFGSSRLFQHVFDEHEPNTVETDVLFKIQDKRWNKRWNDRQWRWFHVMLCVLPLLAMTVSKRPGSRRSIEMTWTFCCFNNSTDLVLYVSSNHHLMRSSSSCAWTACTSSVVWV